MYSVMQLTSGDEIMVEVAVEEDHYYIVKNALRIERIHDGHNTYYTMRSWFIGQFDDDKPKEINLRESAIIATMEPTLETLKQYHSSVEYFHNANEIESEEFDIEFTPETQVIH